MLLLLSPAKSLDYDTPTDIAATTPKFMAEAAQLIELLRPLTPAHVAGLMDLSDALAQLNVGRYAAWRRRATPANSKPALLAFNGDVYDGLDARSLGREDLAWAQEHLVILSGLYGALRPLDALQPYRLEMGTRLANPRGRDLYAWWGDTISRYLNQRQKGVRSGPVPVVVNLASQEYFKAVDRRALKARVVECVFEDWQRDAWRIVSFHAKRARGRMARWAIEQRCSAPEQLSGFDRAGYAWDEAASGPDRLVFRRRTD
ncbi:peroxide stress protein YaaA [Sphaerotilus microaerophilus]|uniref:UPF0246 protein CATMQ487_18870 n=1 Tax=Sphaerotilus microaerophilus TaxID=2914710 RepID=A0ABN6PMX3_9BURK|nr:peroxide stress protein YaaA [Sphaerotilus sp. FB-5]BDI04917.1 UPF0246 protein [Sphaerotilus sp. FB-5]